MSLSRPHSAGTPDTEKAADLVVAEHDAHEVTLSEAEDPQNLPSGRKWLATLVLSASSVCVTCNASISSSASAGVARSFGVSEEVTVLALSLFILGLGLGSLLFQPLGEIYGKNIVYRLSFVFLFIFTFPVAFAPDIAVYTIFRFVCGLCGSAFLCIGGGTISDMFSDSEVATPMAIFTISPVVGPFIGPVIGGFINQNTNWRWTFRVMIIWIFFQTILIVLCVPETTIPVLLRHKAARQRRSTGDQQYWAATDHGSVASALLANCYKPFEILIFDRMAFLLALWNALILGILYLAFQSFPIVFAGHHGFNLQMTGLSFLGLLVGVLLALATQPIWNAFMRRQAAAHGGVPPPEANLVLGQVGGVLVPVGLFWFAFTTYPSVHWIVPILGSVPLGAGMYGVFVCSFTYLAVAYRPVAALALTSNNAFRSSFAAGFPLFAGAMYSRLGTVGATALLAGLTAAMAPLPFIFYFIGARLRAKSRFAA